MTDYPIPPQAEAIKGVVAEVVACEVDRIENERGLMQATNQLATIAATRKNSEAARKALVQPLNDHVKFINGTFKQNMGPLDQVESSIKAAIIDYNDRQEAAAERAAAVVRERQQEQEQAAAAAREREEFLAGLEGRDPEPEVPLPVAPVVPDVVVTPTVHTHLGSTTVTKRWDFEVTDMRAFCAAVASGQVDPSWVEAVGKHIRAAITAKEGEQLRECPGLHIFQASGVTVRG